MIGWYILIGIIIFIALLMLIPIGAGVSFDNDLRAFLTIGFIRITLYPQKPKKEKPKKKEEKPKQEEKKEEKKKEKKPGIIKEKGLDWLIETIKNAAILAKGILKDFFKHLKIKRLQISITYCGENADDTAVKYGYFCLSVYPAVSILVNASKCKKYGVDIQPDFNADGKTEYKVDFRAGIRLLWIFALVFKHGFKALRLILSLRNKTAKDKAVIEEEKTMISERGENVMDHPIGSLMNITMEKIKEMVDVNTIVGEPITSADGTLIIPVSKVSYGFASGGSDLPSKNEKKDLFGGGSGAGVTIQPIAFLTVYQGNVRLINVNNSGDGLDRLVDMVPGVLEKVKGIFKKDKAKDTEITADDFSEITIDDIE